MLIDRFGRKITYLRISITDRCNMRCVYCMPAGGITLQSHGKIMRYEEIIQVVKVAAQNGIREVRITGGEPLVRRDLPKLVRLIAKIPEINDISLTTNAFLLEEMAKPLAEAGLRRVNISLDTLQHEKFKTITRGGCFEKTWCGILAAEKNNLQPIKINMVVMRGINDDELLDMARLSLTHPWSVRFIELMPVKNQASLSTEFIMPTGGYYISVQEIMKILDPLGLHPVDKTIGDGPAREFQIKGGVGRIGFISPVGDHFCSSCNRLRLTADGNLHPCLLNDAEIPILEALRNGETILPLLKKAIALKPEGHELVLDHLPSGRCMRQIGG